MVKTGTTRRHIYDKERVRRAFVNEWEKRVVENKRKLRLLAEAILAGDKEKAEALAKQALEKRDGR